jgi:hypothetical protein
MEVGSTSKRSRNSLKAQSSIGSFFSLGPVRGNLNHLQKSRSTSFRAQRGQRSEYLPFRLKWPTSQHHNLPHPDEFD